MPVDIIECLICSYPWKQGSYPKQDSDEPEDEEFGSKSNFSWTNVDAILALLSVTCTGCWMLTEGVSFWKQEKQEDWIWTMKYECCDSSVLRIRITGSSRDTIIDVQVVPSSEALVRAQITPTTRKSSLTNQDWTRIDQWIGNCNRSHVMCNEYDGTFLPKRVLRLDLADDVVKIVENASVVFEDSNITYRPHHLPRLNYACLSHCWGRSRSPFLTTAETLNRNKEGILVKDLPQTFKDAIYVARNLHIDYLWIDSLCIVQDDEQDWLEEAPLMGTIYRNAHLVIAAGSASSDDDGFFVRRKSVKTREFTIDPGQSNTPRRLDVFMRMMPPHPDSRYSHEDDELPISTRAWILQEKLLARRFLTFGTYEILWECLDKVYLKYDLARIGHEQHRTALNGWHTVVSRYTKRNLTIKRDRLPAISALAKLFQEKLQDRYLAGMWGSGLERELDWILSSVDISEGKRSTDGPSWSWIIAAKGNALLPDIRESEESDAYTIILEDAGIDLQGLDPFGQVIGGKLMLSGCLIRLKLQHDISSSTDSFHSGTDCLRAHALPLEYASERLGIEISGSSDVQQVSPPIQARTQFFPDFIFWDSFEDLNKQLECVQYFLTRQSGSGDRSLHLCGLLLRKVENQQPNSTETYERIANFRFFFDATADEPTINVPEELVDMPRQKIIIILNSTPRLNCWVFALR
ncbi:heterokaryon incompatibility protein-domain-containing protein [Xylariaceae sp. FL0255]|nr:heterokaryon incompatibility protein-domain-containing protein [Xylariaceae sp. FL0255]